MANERAGVAGSRPEVASGREYGTAGAESAVVDSLLRGELRVDGAV